MTIRVQDSDGTIIEFPDGTPHETIAGVMRQRDSQRAPQPPRNRPRSNNPTGSRPGANTISADNAAYSQSRIQRAQERAPRFAPGTPGRALEDFNRNGPAAVFDQMWRNIGIADEVAGAGAYLDQGARNLVRQARGQRIEIPANTAAQAASDYERDERGRVARQQPLVNTASYVASVPAFGGTPAANAPRIGALQAGLATAGTNAPFALARQEGSLQERAPGALQESAVAFGLGAGLQGLANGLSAPARSGTPQSRMAEFDAAGVRAPMAAVQGRQGAPMAMAIAENPIGGNVRRNLQNAADDVAASARNLSGRAGNAEPREISGELVQRAVRRFARDRNMPQPRGGDARRISVRDWSFAAKSRALYDDVFARLARDEESMVGQIDGPLLDTTATQRTLEAIRTRVQGGASRQAMRSPMIERMSRAIGEDAANGSLRFQDLRAWRTWVREAQQNEGLRQGMDNAALQRLEAALTEDIYASAMNIGGQAAHDLRAVDRWYRRISNRINTALQPFDNASGGGQAYRRVIALASQGSQQNTRALQQLRASMRPDEWRTVSATIMDELGNPSFGAPNVLEPGAFSIEHFVTNFARLSPEGRRVLFGPLAPELENLARVAGYLKGVRGFANASRSGSSIQNISTISATGGAAVAAATGNPAPLAMLAGAGLLMRVTGEMLTNPAFVRWLTTSARSPAGRAGMRHQLAMLSTIASRDPAVGPLYTELSRQLGGQLSAPAKPQEASAAR